MEWREGGSGVHVGCGGVMGFGCRGSKGASVGCGGVGWFGW